MNEIAQKQGIKKSTVKGRRRIGWTEEQILNGKEINRVRYGGMTLSELAIKLGVNYETVRARHKRGKWTEQEMIEGKKKRGYKIRHRDREATLKEWAEETGLSVNVLRTRLKDYYDSEDILR